MAASRFTDEQKQQVLDAIAAAENKTSGEIRVHIDVRCPESEILDRAAHLFAKLKMHKTALRNGVLIYVALDDHKFAVIGDKGIHAKVPDHFWEMVTEAMTPHFKQAQVVEALIAGIEMCGEELARDFPVALDDQNELSDDISFG